MNSFIYNAAMIMYNRPYIFRQCPFAKRTEHIPGKCQGGCRAAADPKHPRSICLQAAQETLHLVELWQACTSRGLTTANNTLQHALFTATTVLIIEAGGIQQVKTTQLEQERRALARRLLHEKVIPFFEAIAVRRPAAKRSLDSMHELLINREIEEQQKLALQATERAVVGEGHTEAPPHQSQRLDDRNDAGPDPTVQRPTAQTVDSGLSLSEHSATYGKGRVKLEEESHNPGWMQSSASSPRAPYFTPRASGGLDIQQMAGTALAPPSQQWFDSASSTFPSYYRYAYGDAAQEATQAPTSPTFYDNASSSGQFGDANATNYAYGQHSLAQTHPSAGLLLGTAEAYQGSHAHYQASHLNEHPPTIAQYQGTQPMAMHQSERSTSAYPLQSPVFSGTEGARSIFASSTEGYSRQAQPHHMRASPQLSVSPERNEPVFASPHAQHSSARFDYQQDYQYQQ